MKLTDALVIYDLLPAPTRPAPPLARFLARLSGEMGATEFSSFLENNLPFNPEFGELSQLVRDSGDRAISQSFDIDYGHFSIVHGVALHDLLVYVDRTTWPCAALAHYTRTPTGARPDMFILTNVNLTAVRLRFDRLDPVAHAYRVINHALGAA